MNRPHSATVECPFCGSANTELLSLFGQQLMTVQYYCNSCRTSFERVKGRDILEDAAKHARSDLGDVTATSQAVPEGVPDSFRKESQREEQQEGVQSGGRSLHVDLPKVGGKGVQELRQETDD